MEKLLPIEVTPTFLSHTAGLKVSASVAATIESTALDQFGKYISHAFTHSHICLPSSKSL